MNHIQFITVGFADLINSLPTVACDWCHEPIITLRHTRTVDSYTFCDDFCYSDWAVDAKAESAVRYDD